MPVSRNRKKHKTQLAKRNAAKKKEKEQQQKKILAYLAEMQKYQEMMAAAQKSNSTPDAVTEDGQLIDLKTSDLDETIQDAVIIEDEALLPHVENVEAETIASEINPTETI